MEEVINVIQMTHEGQGGEYKKEKKKQHAEPPLPPPGSPRHFLLVEAEGRTVMDLAETHWTSASS